MKDPNRCRLCLKHEGTLSLFSLINDLKIRDMLGYCCSLNAVEGDGLPENVCNACMNKLKKSFDFRLTCKENDYKLRFNIFNVLDRRTVIEKLKNGLLYKNSQTQTDDSINLKCETAKCSGNQVKEEFHENQPAVKNDFFVSVQKNSRRINSEKPERKIMFGQQSIDLNDNDSNDMDTPLAEILLNEISQVKNDDNPIFSCDEIGEFSSSEDIIAKNIGRRIRGQSSRRDSRLDVSSSVGMKHRKRRLTKYVCEKCGYAANDRTSLRVHYRSHTGERPYVCSICDKSFAVGENLKVHMRRHTGEKPFVCHSCGKAFSAMSSLRGHMRTHSGERPYTCEACGRRFSLRSNMLQHARTHSNNRPHMCKHCGIRFISRSDLSVHSRMHTGERPHACTICGRRFALPSTLANHSRVHTDQRDHVCSHCGRGYISKGSLVVHIKTHHTTYESVNKSEKTSAKVIPSKPHICLHCEKGFVKKSSLKTHMKKHKADVDEWIEVQTNAPNEQQPEIHLSITSATGQNVTRQLLLREQPRLPMVPIGDGQVVSVVSMATVLPITVVPVSILTS